MFPWHAPGLTLLEIVLASALLGMVAAGILGTLSAIWGWQGRQQEVLGAAEVANRLILTYLDDETVMPSQALPVAYGPYRYHWKMDKEPVKIHDPDPVEISSPWRGADAAQDLVARWRLEELGRASEASRAFEAYGREHSERHSATLALLRSADIERRTLNNPGRARYIYEELLKRDLPPDLADMVRERKQVSERALEPLACGTV
jgi:type II secretory pathway pseudopilin PulG